MSYSVCLYHVIWATKNRQPLLTPPVEDVVLNAITHKSTEMDCPVHAVNGCLDHIYVAVSIRPRISVADWAGKVKGVSSRSVNEAFPDLEFAWQSGYGVLTFGQKQMQFVRDYIHNQKEHHRQSTTFDALERSED